jgi:hypothetical protein
MSWFTAFNNKTHELLFNVEGDFSFYENTKAIMNNDVSIFVQETEPLFDTNDVDENSGAKTVKYFPENQIYQN